MDAAQTDLDREVSPRTAGLAVFIHRAIERLQQGKDTEREADGLLFCGIWNDSIPRALIRDPILKPTEVRLWAVIRTLVDSNGPAVMPDHATLAEYTNVGSRTTITAALLILRITRWISLCARVRDEHGKFAGNVYALHDEPVTLADAMHLDPGYVRFLHDMTGHSSDRVRRIARGVLDTIEDAILENRDVTQDTGLLDRSVQRLAFLSGLLRKEDKPDDSDSSLFSVSPRRQKSLKQDHDTRDQNLNMDNPVQKMDTVNGHRVQNLNTDKNKLKNQQDNDHVQKMDTATICSSSYKNKKTTTTNTREVRKKSRAVGQDGLIWPQQITDDERLLAEVSFRALDPPLRQDLLDELQGRFNTPGNSPVRNPVAWLISNSQRAQNGEFRLTSLGIRVRRARDAKAQAEQLAVRLEQHPPNLPPPSPENPYADRIAAMRQKQQQRQRGGG